MVDGQTGELLAVAQLHVVEGLKKKSEFVITPHHLMVAGNAVGLVKELKNAMSFLVAK